MSFQDPPRRPRYPALSMYESQQYSASGGYQAATAAYQDGFDTSQGYDARGYGAQGYGGQWYQPQAEYQAQAGYQGQQAQPPQGWDTQGYQAYSGGQGYQGDQTYATQGYADLTQTNMSRPVFASPSDDGMGLGRRGAQGPGMVTGAMMGFLAAALAIGVSMLVAAFVRPQASPIIAVGGAFIDRTPQGLKEFAVQHFGTHDKTVLLAGMYVTISIIAMIIGVFARKTLAIGVTGIALFGLFGAYVAITRPESHPTDAIPAVIGGIAGITALMWLARSAYSGARA